MEKRKTEWWIREVASEQKATVQEGTKKLSRDSIQLVHTHDGEPFNSRNGKVPGKLANSSAWENNVTEGIPLRKGTRRNVDVWITQSSKNGKERSELPSSIGKLSWDKETFPHTQDMQQAMMVDRSLQHVHRFTPENSHHHQTVSFEVQESASSGKEPKPKFEQRSTTTKTQVLRLEEPTVRKSRSAGRVEYSHSQDGQGAERFESASLGTIVIPDSKQHSFSVNIQQHNPGLETEKQNSQQCITQTRTHGEPPSKLTHRSGGKVQAYSTYTEPATALDDSNLGGLVIVDVHQSQESSSSQVQEVIPHPTVKEKNTEQWRTQIMTHEGLQSEGPRTIQFLANHEGHPITTSDSVSSGNVTVVPGYQHSFSIHAPRQDGKHIDEELIQRQTTTRLRGGGEEQQIITLDGSSNGTVVIPIQIDHASSTANVQVHNG